MQEHFNQELDELKTNLLKMASLVDEQVNRAIKAVETGNIELCKGIKIKDKEIDAYDVLILTQCENILALFQPVATDLRFIMSALLINNQLERCGDIAVNIAQRVKKVGELHSLVVESQIVEMGLLAKEMIKNAIDSFIQNDVEITKKVFLSEDNVDALNKKIFKLLVARMQSDPGLIEPCAHLILLIRQIERLADHATNIAENLIFYVEARIIAHQKRQKHNREDEHME